MADRVGHLLGNYRLIRLLGKGGFAEVYLGEHQYLKTPAAIKLLRTKVANEADLQNFVKEAQTIAQLVHPHIVRILEFGMDGETPFLVMDYAHGTLRQRHPKGSQLPLTTIIPYVKHLAEALQYAHEEKFIHRDVKPENMLVGRRDTTLLSDFGIALIAQSSRYQSTQDIIGTVAYMSPEQIQGKPRPASDQYSLGVVVYEWLSGDRPFHGSFTELCTQHLFASPPSLHEKLPTLPWRVEKVVMTALNKDPKQRFESVQAFAQALEQACQVEPSSSFVLPVEIMLPLEPLPLAKEGSANSLSQQPLLTNKLPTPSESLLQTKSVTGQQPQQVPFVVPPPAPSPSELPSFNEFRSSPRPITRRIVVAGLAAAVVSMIEGSLVLLSGTPLFSVVRSARTPSDRLSPAVSLVDEPVPRETVLLFIDGQPYGIQEIIRPDGTFTIPIPIDPNWPIGSVHTVYAYKQDGTVIKLPPFTVINPTMVPVGLQSCLDEKGTIQLGSIQEGSSQPISKTITLCTQAKNTVKWTAQSNQTWLQFPSSGQVQAPRGNVTIIASAKGLRAGTYNATLLFNSPQNTTPVRLNFVLVVVKAGA